MKKLFSTRWFRIAAGALAVIGAIYGMIYLDVVSRAKEAYLEGEKYWRWYECPAEKKQALDAVLADRLAELTRAREKNELVDEEYNDKVDIARFDHERTMEESSIKYAYVWYQTVVELFAPPESRWVRRAREKMPLALEKWKEELRANNIPFEDYMLE